ncbi:MAG: 50S ribosomal protein L29 [Flavobacteriales bacterium]|jgi:large subunit ribosomal protein L29|nr:50S ribosomal protein L29 [Flavobacteriales bacterium]MBL6876312.1 50S ribosomal protein L29 [Chitinophagales bacterium]|tara:strand:+ start:1447 stop:1638 length:192 start_codon:yes stop_codon:yes gene_type:complete
MKAAELRELSVEDLKAKIVEESKALNTLVLNHAVSPIENPVVIKTTRKLVARLKTILNEKEQA